MEDFLKKIIFVLLIFVCQKTYSIVDNNFLIPIGSVEGITGNTGIARLGSIGSVIYNPAGLAFSKDKKISIAGSAYTQNSITIDNQVLKKDISFFQSTPSQVTTVFNKFGFAFAFSVLVPKAFKLDFNIDQKDPIYNSYIDFETEEAYFGPTVSKKFSSNFAIGISLFYVKKSENLTSNEFNYTDEFNYSQRFETLKISGNTLMASLGLTYLFSPRIILGFKFSTPQINLSSKFTQSYSISETENGEPGLWLDFIEEGDAYLTSPAEIALGLQFRFSDRFKLLTDFAYHFGKKSTTIDYTVYDDKMEKEYLASSRVHIGAEYRFSNNESINFGAQYNQKNSDDSFDFFGFQAGYRKKEEIADSLIGIFVNKNIAKREADGMKIDYLMAGLYLSTSINFIK